MRLTKRSLLSVVLSLVACLLLLVHPALADAPIKTAPILYRDALPAMQQSGVPLKLPQLVVYPNAHGAYGATLNYANQDGYSLTIGNRYPCSGSVCTVATVEAQRKGVNVPDSIEEMFADMDAPNPDPEIKATRSDEQKGWVQLANGQSAFFVPWQSFLGPGYAYLTWDEGDFRYQLSIKFGRKDWLVEMANSIQ
jgi:hypothetical protein